MQYPFGLKRHSQRRESLLGMGATLCQPPPPPPSSQYRTERQWLAGSPSCMFWLQWPGDSPNCTRDPEVAARCSNSVSSLSLHPSPFHSAICMIKSSRPSKDCPGRVRTPVGFSSPSVGSRNPTPSACECPQGCGCPPKSATTASLAPGTCNLLNRLLQMLRSVL